VVGCTNVREGGWSEGDRKENVEGLVQQLRVWILMIREEHG